MSSILALLRFVRANGVHVVKHLLDALNRGDGIRRIADQNGLSEPQAHRLINAITEKRYILRQELIDFIDEELSRQGEVNDSFKRDRKSVLRLASFDDSDKEQNG